MRRVQADRRCYLWGTAERKLSSLKREVLLLWCWATYAPVVFNLLKQRLINMPEQRCGIHVSPATRQTARTGHTLLGGLGEALPRPCHLASSPCGLGKRGLKSGREPAPGRHSSLGRRSLHSCTGRSLGGPGRQAGGHRRREGPASPSAATLPAAGLAPAAPAAAARAAAAPARSAPGRGQQPGGAHARAAWACSVRAEAGLAVGALCPVLGDRYRRACGPPSASLAARRGAAWLQCSGRAWRGALPLP